MKRPLLMVCLCLVAAAALYYFSGAAGSALRNINFREGQEVIVTGRICQKENKKFYLKSITIQDMVNEAVVSQPEQSYYDTKNIKISCRYPQEEGDWLRELKIGSIITICGSWQSYRSAGNPGEFDSREYYQSLRIAGELADIRILDKGNKFSWMGESLYLLRQGFEKRFYQVFPRKEAGILSMMLLGEREGLDGEVKKMYQRNGIIHILSISGLHISLIGMGIYKLLRRLGLPVIPAAVCGGIALLLYGSMTGMSISVCRAMGMYLLRMLSLICGRTYDLLTALGVMAAIMAIRNPAYLGHAGFLLSFSSVLGIGLVYPMILKNLGGGGYVKKTLLAGCCVTLVTLPVQLWFFYEAPVWAVCLNLLVIPCMSILVVSGFAVMLIPGLGIIGTVDCLILTGFEKLCFLFEELPFRSWNPGRPRLWQIALYYGGLLLAVGFSGRGSAEGEKKRKKSLLKWMRLPVIAALILFLGWRPVCRSSMTFLDVGQGDCACLRLDSGEVYLFDCGSVSRGSVGEYVLLPFLKYNGIRRLNAVFVSHADKDHYNGVEELLLLAEQEGIVIEQLVLPGGESPKTLQEEFEELLRAAQEYAMWRPLEIRIIQAGDGWSCGEGSFLSLNPPDDRAGWDKNAASQCLYIEIGSQQKEEKAFTLLLTGDVEGQGEEKLLAQLEKYGIHTVSVLKVAHHGSRYSTSQKFLEQVNPGLAVISCGEKNAYGHPHKELLDRLQIWHTEIRRTPEKGAVTVWMEKGELRVETFR